MYFLTTLIIIALGFDGTLSFQHPEIDINRLKLLRDDVTSYSQRMDSSYNPRNNAINYSNSRSQPSLWHKKTTSNKSPIKIYQPRENPRLFYQSELYTKNTDASKVNLEVSATYPGKDVVWARDNYNQKSARLMRKRGRLSIGSSCIRCPHDRTLIAKAGSDRVLLQSPRLMTCRGRPAPRNIHFLHMYGPQFGSLVERGIHTVLGRISDKGIKTIKQCKMEVTVITQGCSTPKYLRTQCTDHQQSCNFTCRDTRMQLQGEKSLVCGDDLKWHGKLPVCIASNWCEPPPPPSHGRVHCQGATSGSTLMDGSQCRVRCQRGWRSNTRAVPTYCRLGSWTKPLTCEPKTSI